MSIPPLVWTFAGAVMAAFLICAALALFLAAILAFRTISSRPQNFYLFFGYLFVSTCLVLCLGVGYLVGKAITEGEFPSPTFLVTMTLACVLGLFTLPSFLRAARRQLGSGH